MFDYHYILQRKRKLDKLGQSVNLNDPEPAKYIVNQIKMINAGLPGIDAINNNVNDILGQISTTSGKIQAGLSAVQAFQHSFKEPLTDLVKTVTAFEESNAALNESFGMSSQGAAKYAQQLRQYTIGSDVFDIGDEKMFSMAKSVDDFAGGLLRAGKATRGTVDGLSKAKETQESLLKTQKLLVVNWGLTNDQAEAYQLYLAGIDATSADTLLKQQAMSKAIADKTGLDALQVQTSLTKEIAGLTGDIQLQYGQIPGSLELAVLKSKALGISVEQLNRTGESLLDIQGSIGKEIEYQALTGRQLTVEGGKSLTDEYRKATIMGDGNRQAELMNKFIEQEGKGLKTNLLARKKAAELLGTDEAAIAKMIQKRELIQKLGAEELLELKGDEFNAALAKLGEDVKSDPERTALFNQLLTASDTRTTEQIANDLLSQIATNTAYNAGKTVDVMKAREGVTKSLKNEGALQQNITQFDKTIEGGTLGNLMLPMKVVDAVYKPLEVLAQKLPGIAQVAVDALKKLTTISVYAESIGTSNPAGAGTTPTRTVTTPAGTTPNRANRGVLPTYADGGELSNSVTHTDASVSGGVLIGPSHKDGGIPTKRGEVEGGEYIINKRSTEKYLPLIEMINASKGNTIPKFDKYEKLDSLNIPGLLPNTFTKNIAGVSNYRLDKAKETEPDLNLKDYRKHVSTDYTSNILKSNYNSSLATQLKSDNTPIVENATTETPVTLTAPKQTTDRITTNNNNSQTNVIDYTKLAKTIIDAIKTIKPTNTEWKEFADTVSQPISKALSTPVPVTVTVKNNDRLNNDFAMNSNKRYGF